MCCFIASSLSLFLLARCLLQRVVFELDLLNCERDLSGCEGKDATEYVGMDDCCSDKGRCC